MAFCFGGFLFCNNSKQNNSLYIYNKRNIMLRLKKEHIGKVITKGNDRITLTEEMSQKQLLYVKNMISAEFVEDVSEEKHVAEKEVEAYVSAKQKTKRNKDAGNSEESVK